MSTTGGRTDTRPGKNRLSPREALVTGVAGYIGAALLPALLWRASIGAMAADFRLDPGYLVTGWTGYGLILLGLAFFAPVVVSIGRRPGDRFYPKSRSAYAAWGLSLYLLGVALASQVAAVTGQHPVG